MPTPPEQASGGGRTHISPLQWLVLGILLLLLLDQLGIINLLGPGGAGLGGILSEAPSLVALVLAITVHEFSHGLVATSFGDTTPRRAGRLTLNPLKHLDPIGTILILVGPIGWGRPMPINPGEMRNPNLGWALSSLAGPVSNIVVASLCVLAAAAVRSALDPSIAPYVAAFIQINVFLAVFNLVPIPPLDGFGFLFGLSPRPLKLALAPLHQYGPLLLIAVLFIPGLRTILGSYLNAGANVVFDMLNVLSRAI